MKKFKVGDKVFCEYEHATITNIKNGKVTGVSFKYFMRSSQDLTGRCFLVSESDESICNRFLNAESFWEQGEGKYARYVYFDINIDEINFDEVVYFYEDSKGKLREKRLCSRLKDGRCIAKKSFRDGEVLLNIQINDEAGNYEVGVVGLDVDY